MSRNYIPVPGSREVFAEGPEQPACPSHARIAAPPPQPLPAPKAPPAAARKPGILVVDDDGDVRGLLQVVLGRHGFVVWEAAAGLQALEVYQEWGSSIDLVLLDVRMPGLDGPQTLVGLRQLNPALCCCFMTGDAGCYTPEELIARGAVYVFQKPFRPFEVAQLLWQLVRPPATEVGPAEARGRYAGSPPELFRG